MTVLVEWAPGDPGTPPHRHSGPCFGYVIEGAVRWELEGEPEHVIKAGETFWEPGGDVIHYQNGNALSDASAKYVVFMMCAPGQPMLTLVEEEELDKRAHLRAPRPWLTREFDTGRRSRGGVPGSAARPTSRVLGMAERTVEPWGR